MKRSIAVVATTAAAALAAPAQAATLTADPSQPCYRETQRVFLFGSGFTPNAPVDFVKDGVALVPTAPITATPAGEINPVLTLPGLNSGQRLFSYVATDSVNTGEISMLVTATDVILKPEKGNLAGRLTISGRGFFGGRHVYAHVARPTRRNAKSKRRNIKIGKVKGACKKVKAKRRLLPARPALGVYRIQFDTFRRYERSRHIKASIRVTIVR